MLYRSRMRLAWALRMVEVGSVAPLAVLMVLCTTLRRFFTAAAKPMIQVAQFSVAMSSVLCSASASFPSVAESESTSSISLSSASCSCMPLSCCTMMSPVLPLHESSPQLQLVPFKAPSRAFFNEYFVCRHLGHNSFVDFTVNANTSSASVCTQKYSWCTSAWGQGPMTTICGNSITASRQSSASSITCNTATHNTPTVPR